MKKWSDSDLIWTVWNVLWMSAVSGAILWWGFHDVVNQLVIPALVR